MKKEAEQQYCIRRNLKYVITDFWKSDRFYLFLRLLMIPLTVFLPLTLTYLSKVFVSLAETEGSFSPILKKTVLLILLLAFMKFLNSFVQAKLEEHVFLATQERDFRINQKCMEADFESIDDPKTMVNLEKAFQSVHNEGKGYISMVNIFSSLLSNLLGLILYSALITRITPWILLLVAASSLLNYWIGIQINKWNDKNCNHWLKLDNELNYLQNTSSNFDAAKDIRLFSMGPWFHNMFKKMLKERIHWTYRMQLNYYMSGAVDNLMLLLRDGVAYACLVVMVLDHQITLSEFVLYFGLIGGFSNWCHSIISDCTDLHQANLNATYYRKIIELPSKRRTSGGEKLPPMDSPCEITLSHVTYTYPANEKSTLKDLNLTIKPGEKIAVVGANGAGKTTLVKLLCGLYSATEGDIRIAGTKIEDYNRDEYFQLISPVFQDTQILPLSIERNITFQEKEEIDQNRLKQCIRLAGLEEKIEKLPQKLDSLLVKDMNEDSISLSGGEMQKLMLARALYKNTPIMILDEPTAALDPIAESNMYIQYNELTKNKTSIFISHRLASTRFCDRILLMDQGEIKECGTHDELMKLQGLYYNMFETQAKYYKEKKEGESDENDISA